jgi:hypothetical protein
VLCLRVGRLPGYLSDRFALRLSRAFRDFPVHRRLLSARGVALPFKSRLEALEPLHLTPFRGPLALVRLPLALVGDALPLVRQALARIGARVACPETLDAGSLSAVRVFLTGTPLPGALAAFLFPLCRRTLALVDRALALVGEPFALVRQPLALVGDPLALVPKALKPPERRLALVLTDDSLPQHVRLHGGQPLALRGELLTLLRDALVLGSDALALGGDALTFRRQLGQLGWRRSLIEPVAWFSGALRVHRRPPDRRH